MQSSTTEKNAGRRMLCAITLTCYATMLAGLFVVGYTVFSLAARTLDESIFTLYSRQMF
jgi:hypothetical protein